MATNLGFDDGAYHPLVVHYKADTQTLDAYLDNKLVAEDFTASHGDYAVNYFQLNSNRGAGSYDYFHGIQIGQAGTGYSGVCGDGWHPYPTGDFNLDCLVDFADFAALTEYWMLDTNP